MTEVIIYSKDRVQITIEDATECRYIPNFTDIICDLFKRSNQEFDVDHVTLIAIDKSNNGQNNGLDKLSYRDKALLLKYYFSHLNLMVVDVNDFDNAGFIDHLNSTITKINDLMKNRISRLETWTGCGHSHLLDSYNYNEQICDIIETMSKTIDCTVNKSTATIEDVIRLKDLMIANIDFQLLLYNLEINHLSKLCNLVGLWSFPAHELSNDDLVYCVYLILKYCLRQLDDESINLSNNALLGMIFIIRNCYKNGNAFHNFRHAVDVLQACFHYVIRLGYLPSFTQFQNDPKMDDVIFLNLKKFGNAIELIPMKKLSKRNDETSLNLYQTLALLLAAIGHDVGHPGVTNAFMIKHATPASLLYNERSVLELFHSSVFINKILVIHWPQLLGLVTDDKTNLTIKELIITSILATDMAEHFEYIDKLTHFSNDSSKLLKRVKLISSLLIKCADISNVTRPLRVSAQWASVLSREFDEVAKLESKIATDIIDKDINPETLLIKHDKVSSHLQEILEANPNIHKGQIFFINTFAESLFNSIVELLPELKFTCDIVKENKEFWLNRH